MKKNTKILNLFGGPGTGKSTICAGVFSELKWRNIDCEMATEYAKDKVWGEDFKTLECQPYIFGKQLYRIHRLLGKVDIIVTDSPLLLSVIYDKSNSDTFKKFVLEQINTMNNFNVFLERKKSYNPNGRMQTEKEAIEIDKRIKSMFENNYVKGNVGFFEATRESVINITNFVTEGEIYEIDHRRQQKIQ